MNTELHKSLTTKPMSSSACPFQQERKNCSILFFLLEMQPFLEVRISRKFIRDNIQRAQRMNFQLQDLQSLKSLQKMYLASHRLFSERFINLCFWNQEKPNTL